MTHTLSSHIHRIELSSSKYPLYVHFLFIDMLLITYLFFVRPSKDIVISRTEYMRLLKAEVQGIRFKESCQNKASEIKKLQMQVAYYKKQVLSRTGEEPKEPEPSDSANVN